MGTRQKADGSTSTRSVTRQKEKKTSAEKGVIKADLVSDRDSDPAWTRATENLFSVGAWYPYFFESWAPFSGTIPPASCPLPFLVMAYFSQQTAREQRQIISRWALIFVVEARQRAKGFYAEGRREEYFSQLTFIYIPSFVCAYLLTNSLNACYRYFSCSPLDKGG